MRCILLPLQILATVWPTHTIVDTCDVCGRHPLVPSHGRSEQVVGGADAQPGAWPWVVSLQLPTITGHKHSCGGSLVSGRWILTAAHCFLNKRDLPHWRAVIGAWKLSSLGSEVHVRYIKRIVIHEDYQRSTETSDIALMELDQPVKCSYYIQPACLPDMTVSLSPLNHCYISGWGILGKAAAREVSDVMHEVRVDRFSVAQCNSSGWYNGAIEGRTLCAGYEEGGADICQGDSGGPLMCQEDSSQPFWIIGITSWGQGCGKAHKPGVYTDTQHFYPWIKQLAGPMPQPPPTPMPIPTIKVPLQSESTPHTSSAPKSSPSTPRTPTEPSTPLQTTSRKQPLIFFWPPTTARLPLWPKAPPLSQPTSEVPSKPPTQPHATSPNTVQIEVLFQTTQGPTSPHAKPSSSSPTHATSQVLSSSSSSHAKVLPASTVQPKPTPLLAIKIISEPTSKSPPQPPTPSKTEGTSLLASIIQSSLQTSPQPSSSSKTEISSHATSQVTSPSSSSHAKVLPASTVQPETTPLFEIEIVSELVETPPQPPSLSETEGTSLLASTVQSALQTSPQPSTSPNTETSSHATSHVLSSSSSSHAKVLHESTAQPETTPLFEIEIVSELVSGTPPHPPSLSETESTSLLASTVQSSLHTEPQHTTEPLPEPEIPTEVGSTSETESQPSPGTNPEPEASHQSITTSQPTSNAPHQPSPETVSQPELEATTQPVTTSQTTLETPTQSETQPSPQTTSEPKSEPTTHDVIVSQTTSEAPTQSETQPPPQTTSEPESEPTAHDVNVPQTTSEAPTQSETQPSPQTMLEPETDSAAHVVIVLQSTSEAPTDSETLQTEPKLEPETPLLPTTVPPATSPPTSPSSPETTPQPETSRQPNPEAHPNPQSPQAPSQPIAERKIVPIIEISNTDNIVLRFLRVIQKFLRIIRKLKDTVWVWPDLSNLKLLQDSDLASLEEEWESPPELPGESW